MAPATHSTKAFLSLFIYIYIYVHISLEPECTLLPLLKGMKCIAHHTHKITGTKPNDLDATQIRVRITTGRLYSSHTFRDTQFKQHVCMSFFKRQIYSTKEVVRTVISSRHERRVFRKILYRTPQHSHTPRTSSSLTRLQNPRIIYTRCVCPTHIHTASTHAANPHRLNGNAVFGAKKKEPAGGCLVGGPCGVECGLLLLSQKHTTRSQIQTK